jgi:hypothetical protein
MMRLLGNIRSGGGKPVNRLGEGDFSIRSDTVGWPPNCSRENADDCNVGSNLSPTPASGATLDQTSNPRPSAE